MGFVLLSKEGNQVRVFCLHSIVILSCFCFFDIRDWSQKVTREIVEIITTESPSGKPRNVTVIMY